MQVGLAERVNASLDIVSEAIRFGCFTGLLAIEEGARLKLGDKKLKPSAVNALGEEPGQAIKRAGRLGYWFAAAGSTRSVFDIMGLTVRRAGILRPFSSLVCPVSGATSSSKQTP